MQTPFPAEIPEETRRLVEPLLSEKSVYRLIGAEIDRIIQDEDFIDMYAEEGRPAVNPVILALVSVFQFIAKLPDRLAAEAVVMRMDWKYALRQELSWSGFHYSDLCNFRKRLLKHGKEWVVFERLVAYLGERGYLKSHGKQRTDATKILGLVTRLSRLELVWETIRMGLSALMSADAPWVMKKVPTAYIRAHSQQRRDYRLTKAEIAEAMVEAGREAAWLVGQVAESGSKELKSLPEMRQLRRVLEEQYTQDEEGNTKPRPPGQRKGDVITSPHDPEVRYGMKGGQGWVGYKLQVTETAGEEHRFITDVEIVPANRQDNQCLEAIQDRLLEHEIVPAKQYVDQAYISGSNIADSQAKGIDLRGRVREGNTSKAEGYRLRDFEIDIKGRQAICPAGKRQVKWYQRKPETSRLIAHQVRFGPQCQSCPHFGPGLCTDKPSGRVLGISEHHDIIQARRREAQSAGFIEEMNIRAGIEGTISEMVRGHAGRRSRYRGRRKNQLQALFIAVAVNLKRLARCSSSFLCAWRSLKPSRSLARV
jgi:transposase